MKALCKVVVIAVVMMVAAPVFAANLSGYIHSDWGFQSTNESQEEAVVDFQVRYNLRGRKELENGVFIEAFGQARATPSGASVRDAWVMVGKGKLSFKMGRFEKTEIVERGEEIYFAPVASEAENIRWRVLVDSGIGRTQGDLALVYQASEALKIEIGGVWFPSQFAAISESESNDMGLRPLIQYQNKSFMVIAGGEFRRRATRDDSLDQTKRDTTAFGGTLEKRFGKYSIGVAGGIRYDRTDGADGNSLGEVDSSMVSGYFVLPLGEADKLGFYGGHTLQDFTATGEETVEMGLTFFDVAYIHKNFLSIEGTEFSIGAGYTKAGKDEDERGFGGILRLTWIF